MFRVTKCVDGKPITYKCNIGCVECYKPHIFSKREYWLCVAVGWDSEKQDYIYWGVTTQNRKDLDEDRAIDDNYEEINVGKGSIDWRFFYYYGPDHLVKLSDLRVKHEPYGRYRNMASVYKMMQKYKYHLYFNKPTYLDGLIYTINQDDNMFFIPFESYRKIDTAKGLIINGKEHYHIYKGYMPLSNLTVQNIHSRLTWTAYENIIGVYENNVECFSDDGYLESTELVFDRIDTKADSSKDQIVIPREKMSKA